MLQLENLLGLGTKNLTALLSCVLIRVVALPVRRRGRRSRLPLLRRPGCGYFLEMVYMGLDVVNIPQDRPPVSSQLFQLD